MKVLKYSTYSKINLGLQVLNLRSDGYHNINTVFLLIKLFDSLEISISDKIEIITSPELNIPLVENLIYKAGKIFLEKYNINSGFKVKIQKNIPTGGGLGGGSSNAVTTIIALNELFKLSVPISELMPLVSKIGSDCPFFLLNKRVAVGRGKGEILEGIDFEPNFKIALINPGIHISTPTAYKMLGRNSDEINEINFTDILLKYSNEPDKFKNLIINDFENVVFQLYPEIAEIKEKLYEIGADFALMSGSGSTVFGIFRNDIDLEFLQRLFPKYFCYITE
jgi:4-diphosphocytidyl-2-C-methyl-D-erythritol kinase